MKQSPLNLDHYRLLEVSVKPVAKFVASDDVYPEINDADLTAIVSLGEKDKDNDIADYAVRLKLSLSPKKENSYPYTIVIEAEGFFSVAQDVFGSKEEEKNIVVVNGASMLFGALREVILTITGRFQYGSIMLPTVSLKDFAVTEAKMNEKSKKSKNG